MLTWVEMARMQLERQDAIMVRRVEAIGKIHKAAIDALVEVGETDTQDPDILPSEVLLPQRINE